MYIASSYKLSTSTIEFSLKVRGLFTYFLIERKVSRHVYLFLMISLLIHNLRAITIIIYRLRTGNFFICFILLLLLFSYLFKNLT